MTDSRFLQLGSQTPKTVGLITFFLDLDMIVFSARSPKRLASLKHCIYFSIHTSSLRLVWIQPSGSLFCVIGAFIIAYGRGMEQ